MVDKKFAEQCLRAHNDYRSKHGVSSLKLNKDISAIAQKWADHLVKTNSFQHSPDRTLKGEKMGENIAMKWTSTGEDFTGQQVTDQWYSEIERYDFGRSSGPSTGHFTQVVWRSSRELGVGRAQARDGKWIVVANYMPAGNFIGRYAENVQPPKDGKIRVPERTSSPSSSGAARNHVSTARVTHTPEYVRTFATTGPQTSKHSTRTVVEERGGGPRSYTKTVVTETVIGPDGQKRVVTRETVSDAGDDKFDMPQFSSRLRSLDIKSENPFGRAFGGFDRGFGDVGRDYGYSDRFGDSRKPAIQTYTYTNSDQERGAKASKKPQSMKDFIDDVVKAHNKYRRKHRASDLRHNKEMSALAQSWADHLAKTSTLGHSNHSYKGSELGENVATKWTSTGEDYTGQEVTEQWYKEIEKYNWRAATFQSGTGHFTQVVWKGSREIGVGKSQSRDGRVFVVANYSPAGNVMGQFSENVLAG